VPSDGGSIPPASNKKLRFRSKEMETSVRSKPFSLAVRNIDFRSERRGEYLDIFEDWGILDLLDNNSNQVIFGRRGSGKTHLIGSFEEKNDRIQNNDKIVTFVDLRDASSMCLVDAKDQDKRKLFAFEFFWRTTYLIFVELKSKLERQYVATSDEDKKDKISDALSKVNELLDLISENRISHQVGILLSEKMYRPIGFKTKNGDQEGYLKESSIKDYLESIVKALGLDYIVILLDEWSSIPPSVQPYFADMIKKTLIVSPKISAKISTIRFRTRFSASENTGDSYGLELGADVFGDIDLDTIKVWEKDLEGAVDFYKKLLSKHITFELNKFGITNNIFPENSLINILFSSEDAFKELVRAGEGIPRDFLNVFKRAYSLYYADTDKKAITMKHIRTAAMNWYEEDKLANIDRDSIAYKILEGIINHVITKFKKKAFLVTSELSRDEDLQSLVDLRLLHRIHQGWSSKSEPGKRYDIFSIDYGSFIRLLDTKEGREIDLDLFKDLTTQEKVALEQPLPDLDLRSIRRIIVDEKYLK
jgi:hypothetical protein